VSQGEVEVVGKGEDQATTESNKGDEEGNEEEQEENTEEEKEVAHEEEEESHEEGHEESTEEAQEVPREDKEEGHEEGHEESSEEEQEVAHEEKEEGHEEGDEEHEDATEEGHVEEHEEEHEEGDEEERVEGHEEGDEEGHEEDHEEGQEKGHEEVHEEVDVEAREEFHEEGHEDGHEGEHKNQGSSGNGKNRRFFYCGGPEGVVEGQCRPDKGCRQRYGPSFGGFCVKSPGAPAVLEDGLAKNVILRRLTEISGLLDSVDGPLLDEDKEFKVDVVRCSVRRAKTEMRELLSILRWLERTMANPALDDAKIMQLYGVVEATVHTTYDDLKSELKGFELVNLKNEPEENAGKVDDLRDYINSVIDAFKA